MNLFQLAPEGHTFVLHSGEESKWKVECDALTDEDWETLALMLAKILPPFGHVTYVPTGGEKLRNAIDKYHARPSVNTLLIVDDVFTSGNSMKETYDLHSHSSWDNIIGAVIFSRGKTPDWITPLFQMPLTNNL